MTVISRSPALASHRLPVDPLRCATALVLVLAVGAGIAATPAQAADAPPRDNSVNFSSSAEVEVTKDLLAITLQAVRDGSDAQTVQTQLKQQLDTALSEARRAAQPGAMAVRTGNFSLSPRYGKDGRITGWQGQAELVLDGKDVPRIAQTAGRLAGMAITQVGYSISPELLAQHEAAVTAEAIAKYRARADQLTKQFGFRGWQLRDVSVQTGEHGGARPMFRVAAASIASSDTPVPVEAGKGTITATVNGSIQLMP